MTINKKKQNQLWTVNCSEDGKVRYMHFGTEWIQGSMRLDKPFLIDLDYAQRMMAWLLFVAPSSVSERKAMQLGLGSAAISKFCCKYLKMNTTAIEINPLVISACRTWFKLPDNNELLKVVQADAAQYIKDYRLYSSIDALQVDLYDDEAAAPALDSVEFYQDCQRLLTDEGIMTVNLFGRASSFSKSWQKIITAFGENCCYSFYPTKDGNIIVLASKKPLNFNDELLLTRAEYIKQNWKLPAQRWLNLLQKPQT